MKNRRLLTMTTIGLLLTAPTALADHRAGNSPFDAEEHEACDPDYGGDPDTTACLTWEVIVDYYHCGIWVAGDGANVALYTIQRTVDEAFPLVHQVKCNLHNGVEDDRQWWNNDVFAWERAVWCWAWGGPNTCPDDPDTPKNEERQSMFWYIMNVLFDCREEGCPNSPPAAPSLLPPPPPYP